MLLIFPTLWAFAVTAGTEILSTQFGPPVMQFVEPALILIPSLLIIAFCISRLTNLGMSRWWFFANFVPFLNIWLGYRTFACPAGYAYYKKLDGVGIFLAIVYWLLFAISILIVALVVALLVGALGSPDHRQQLLEFLQKAGKH